MSRSRTIRLFLLVEIAAFVTAAAFQGGPLIDG